MPDAGTGAVEGTVWSDADGDGIQDPGEVGIPDVTVELRGTDGNVVATTTSGPDGSYIFTGVNPE